MEAYKPIPFYFITTSEKTELTLETARKSFAALKDANYGGVVLFNKPPTGFSAEEYLSEKWFWAIENFIKAGLEFGLSVWINDGFNFPPGDVGGRVAEMDNTLWAYHLVKKDDQIVPERATWGFPAFENPRSSELFIQLVYEAYKKHLGHYFGRGITGFFSDADNRRVNYRVFVQNSPERDYFPWSEDFAEGFQQRYGYDITPYLPQIMERANILQAADYWEYAGELYQSWFRANANWCRENGLLYTFHTSDTSPFPISVTERSSVFTEGRALSFEAIADYCGTDQELLEVNGGLHYVAELLYVPDMRYGEYDEPRHKDYYSVLGDVRTKQAQSAAYLYDRRGVMCELFAASGWSASYERLREIAAFQIMQGATMLVPHAVHHRLRGELKFFAPPVFCPQGTLSQGLTEFNEMLSETVAKAANGKLLAPVAVLDITRDLWQSKGNSQLFLEVCHKLNRMPQGYVIAEPKEIEAKRGDFAVVVNTGAPVEGTIAGIPVLNVTQVSDLETIEQFVPCQNRYEGEGNPHYMRRCLSDGSMALLVANIEDGSAINGVVHFEDETFDVRLETGEIAYFSKTEKYYTKPQTGEALSLPATMTVEWDCENVVPLVVWQNQTGETVLKSGGDIVIQATFTVESGAEVQKLYIPKEDVKQIVKIEGVTLGQADETQIFDDAYYCYPLEGIIGTQTLTIHKTGSLAEERRIYLSGDFDVSIHNHGTFDIRYLSQYNLDAYIPSACDISLKPRSRRLSTNCSAAEQGHPFYCGGVTYCGEVFLDAGERNYVLELGEAPSVVMVSINGEMVATSICRPHQFFFTADGTIELSIHVLSTGANFLECWKAPFGMLEGGQIKKV